MRKRNVYNFTLDNNVMEQFKGKIGRMPQSQAIESFIVQYLEDRIEIR
jgi:hypothetical protein